ncbi:16876_t:CDS:2, partial [Dentiscutata heterogama]
MDKRVLVIEVLGGKWICDILGGEVYTAGFWVNGVGEINQRYLVNAAHCFDNDFINPDGSQNFYILNSESGLVGVFPIVKDEGIVTRLFPIVGSLNIDSLDPGFYISNINYDDGPSLDGVILTSIISALGDSGTPAFRFENFPNRSLLAGIIVGG